MPFTPIKILPEHLLLRNVHPTYIIEEEGEISHDAFKPRENESGELENGVSVNIHHLVKKVEKVCFKGQHIYSLLAKIPYDCAYDCIHDHGDHGLIAPNESPKLFNDTNALLKFAENAKFVYKSPHPLPPPKK